MITLDDLIDKIRIEKKDKENNLNKTLEIMQKLHESRYNYFIKIDTSSIISGHRRNQIKSGIGVMIIEKTNIVG